MSKRTYTEEQLREAVKSSFSFREVLNKLGLVAAGNAYKIVQRTVDELKLDTSHFKRPGGYGGGFERPLQDYLDNKCSIGSSKLKEKLYKAGLLKAECKICGITEWQGKSLSLELDHINGDSQDNSLCNLRILCPNCHSQTETSSGKNAKKYPARIFEVGKDSPKDKKKYYCKCGAEIKYRKALCKECMGRRTK